MVTLIYVKDFSKFFEEHKEFIENQYKESTESVEEARPLNPDLDLFQKMIDINSFNIFEVFDEDKFIGYISLTMGPSMVNKGFVDAVVDHIVLDKEYRKKGVSLDMLSQIEEFLKDSEVDEVKLSIPATKQHDKFADRAGYIKTLSTHIKRLV